MSIPTENMARNATSDWLLMLPDRNGGTGFAVSSECQVAAVLGSVNVGTPFMLRYHLLSHVCSSVLVIKHPEAPQGDLMKTQIDVAGLYAALDATRRSNEISWRGLARDLELSPSLFSRLANGLKPDSDSFATLVSYLRVDADQFFTNRREVSLDSQPELVAQLAPLLRARKDLSEADVAYLEEVISATLRRARAAQGG